MSDLGEIQEAIEKLSEDQRTELRRWLDALGDDGGEESDELMAAIDEGIRSLEVQGAIPAGQKQTDKANVTGWLRWKLPGAGTMAAQKAAHSRGVASQRPAN